MKITVILVVSALSSSAALAQTDAWSPIEDPTEVRELISDRTLDGKYWMYYLRPDGKLAYEQGGFTSIRDWRISDAGEICMYINGMPDKLIECQALWRSNHSPAQHKLIHPRGESVVEITEPEQALVDILLQQVGPSD